MSYPRVHSIAAGHLKWPLGGIGAAFLTALVVPWTGVVAQAVAAAVSGIVTDSSGIPVAGATVSLAGGAPLATTDENGQFHVTVPGSGAVQITVRRLGFAPVVRDLTISGGQPIDDLVVKMSVVPGMLSPVLVKANRAAYSGRLAGYYKRLERHAGGYFIARDELDKKSYRNLSQLLRTIPGINAFPLKSGGGAVRMRGRGCRPLVWLDGTPMPAGEVDLDAFQVNSLHGVEVYLGSTSVPQDYTASNGLSECGTILLWSRGPDTDPAARSRKAQDLSNVIASLRAFSSDQVDKPAVLANEASLDLNYPPELLADAITGSVLAEFIVDETGAVERETIAIVSSNHSLFSAAVSRALRSASYVPATRDGRPVRQVVQQPFTFVSGRGRTTQGLH